MHDSHLGAPQHSPKADKESGKVGLAILLWLLGVPGSIVLLYLIFAH